MERSVQRLIVLMFCLVVCGGVMDESAASAPEIKILFAGNPDDVGGPYWLPALEDSAFGYAPDGYYTDYSRQEEDWIEIHVEATDTHGIASVQLYWLAAKSPTSRPTTYGPFNFTWNSGLSCWVINTDTTLNFPQPEEGTYYSFNVKATDYFNWSTTLEWRKAGPESTTPRRWVQLAYDTESIDYTPYYLDNGSFTMNLNGERGAKDRFSHDTGTNDGDWDIGGLQTKPPSTIEQRTCTYFVGYWFDASACADTVSISDIYYHIWTSSYADTFPGRCFGWGRTQEDIVLAESSLDLQVMSDVERSTYVYDDGRSTTSNNYKLLTGVIDDLDTSESFSDNSINEMYVYVRHFPYNPCTISSRDVPSFVIFNVPDPDSLVTWDTDGDGLSDEQELYGILDTPGTFTSPFLADTDNDGYDDDDELAAATDPNDPDDVPTGREALGGLTLTSGLQLRMENPLQAGSAITFRLPAACEVDLSVFDVKGRSVRRLVQGTYEAGDHAVTWDGNDAKGKPVSAGLYFCTLKTAEQMKTSKVILTR